MLFLIVNIFESPRLTVVLEANRAQASGVCWQIHTVCFERAAFLSMIIINGNARANKKMSLSIYLVCSLFIVEVIQTQTICRRSITDTRRCIQLWLRSHLR